MIETLIVWLKQVPGLMPLKRAFYITFGVRKPPVVETSARFRGHYDKWRMARIQKLQEILGTGWFPSKRILEVGCGHGSIGEYLQTKLGANVTLAEARAEHIEEIRRRLPGFNVIQIDNDKPYQLNTAYDLIIHWGLLYHLNNWRADLLRALKHTSRLCLETEVCDSSDPKFEIKINEESRAYDQAVHGIGSRPSAAMIEKFLKEHGCNVTRYDDPSLSVEGHNYHWRVTDSKRYGALRRFWMITK